MQAFGEYKDEGTASTVKSRDYKDATDLVVGSFYPQMKAESKCYTEDGKANTLINGTNPGYQNAVVYGIDRAAFNQGKNAQYNFTVEEDKAQTIVSRGPGGGTEQIVGTLNARDFKGVGNQYVDEEKLILHSNRGRSNA